MLVPALHVQHWGDIRHYQTELWVHCIVAVALLPSNVEERQTLHTLKQPCVPSGKKFDWSFITETTETAKVKSSVSAMLLCEQTVMVNVRKM